MSDPFRPHIELPKVPKDAGRGNAMFLHDVTKRVPVETLRTNVRQGKYPNLNAQWARDNLAFWGMQ